MTRIVLRPASSSAALFASGLSFVFLALIGVIAVLSGSLRESHAQEIAPPIENFRKIGPHLYSGGEPDTEEDFAFLKRQGVTIVLSVDGAKPNLEWAEKHGLKYVHVPMGYDGPDEHVRLSLAKVATDKDAVVFVHCHHGLHRGPAAAALIGLNCKLLDKSSAKELLKVAGTSPKYQGLWRAVEEFVPHKEGTVLPELVAVDENNQLALSMADLDRAFESIAEARIKKPDATQKEFSAEDKERIVLIEENFKEFARLLPQGSDAKLVQWAKEAQEQATTLRMLAEAQKIEEATSLLRMMSKKCTTCHTDFRQ